MLAIKAMLAIDLEVQLLGTALTCTTALVTGTVAIIISLAS